MRISTRALAAAGIALAFSPLCAETASAQTKEVSTWNITCAVRAASDHSNNKTGIAYFRGSTPAAAQAKVEAARALDAKKNNSRLECNSPILIRIDASEIPASDIAK